MMMKRGRGHFVGLGTSRHGDSLDGRQANAQYGRHRRAHVHDACTGEREHRDDQPGRERDQHLLRHRRSRRCQGAQPHPSELSPDQARRSQGPRSVTLFLLLARVLLRCASPRVQLGLGCSELTRCRWLCCLWRAGCTRADSAAFEKFFVCFMYCTCVVRTSLGSAAVQPCSAGRK